MGKARVAVARSFLAALAIAAGLAATPARADPAADTDRYRVVGNQLSEDLITCSAFLVISAQGGRNRGRPEDIRTAEGLEREAVMAMMFAENVSKSIGQKPEVPQLRLNAIAKSLMAEMDGHFMNFSVLSSKYLAKCVVLLRDPKATVDSRFGFSDQAEDAGPIPITVDPFTKAVAERNGFRIEVYKIRVADGRLLLVPSVDEQAAMQAAEGWAKANPVRGPSR